ncbi:MAG: type I phosphomannose isomerase catalytic subunit [Phycisphaerae bacterium]
MNDVYPLRFQPIYKPKIWGGRNLERLFDRGLPAGEQIGESWELADLKEGVSIVLNGPEAGVTLTELTARWGSDLLGAADPMPDGRFPLLLKLLDANGILSLQVHPDEKAVEEIGEDAALKTECWYYVESRKGYIYKGVREGVSPDQFRTAVQEDHAEDVVRRKDVQTGGFDYLPAGTVHALGPGLVVAEVQTPSDTTYRVTDWGRGREIHLERSMQCIRFDLTGDRAPGAEGDTLLVTDYFTVAKRTAAADEPAQLPQGVCTAVMVLDGFGPMHVGHNSDTEPRVPIRAGDTVLLPATLEAPVFNSESEVSWLEVTLPNK